MDLIYFIFLSSNQEPGERLFVGLITGALTGFVMWLLGRKWKKQENKEFQENKAEAFVNSDSKGSGDYYEFLYFLQLKLNFLFLNFGSLFYGLLYLVFS